MTARIIAYRTAVAILDKHRMIDLLLVDNYDDKVQRHIV